jgi:hypothetical protein
MSRGESDALPNRSRGFLAPEEGGAERPQVISEREKETERVREKVKRGRRRGAREREDRAGREAPVEQRRDQISRGQREFFFWQKVDVSVEDPLVGLLEVVATEAGQSADHLVDHDPHTPPIRGHAISGEET